MQYKDIDIRWLGQSGFLLKYNDKNIYIDPFKLHEEQYLFKADMILITHSHYDHCSIADIQEIVRDKTIVVCTADSQSKMRHIDLKLELVLAEPGKKIELEEGKIKIWAVPAYNINKTAHTKDEDWVGYLIQLGDTTIYHAGDTDLIPEMKHLKDVDIAMLPIGGTFTMNAGEAAKAAVAISPKLAIPMHYGSIVGNKEDADIFVKQCSTDGIQAKILEKEKI